MKKNNEQWIGSEDEFLLFVIAAAILVFFEFKLITILVLVLGLLLVTMEYI